MRIAINLTDGQPHHRVNVSTSRWVVISFSVRQARAAAELLLRLADQIETLDCDKRRAHNHEEFEV